MSSAGFLSIRSPIAISMTSQYFASDELGDWGDWGTQGGTFPPPGLHRMVVGEPENIQAPPSVPPGLNRMVTGTETTPSDYYNYQRQADGEVSQSPPQLPRPPISSSFTPISSPFAPISSPFTQHHYQNNAEPSQAPSFNTFNTSDRNLYLVTGESDLNHQRVIPGVESDNSIPTNIMNHMQSLHIQDDDGFINASVPAQERNVDVDGMETEPEVMQVMQRPVDSEPREEAIDGANDNVEADGLAAVSVQVVANHLGTEMVPEVIQRPVDPEPREEDIEGANAIIETVVPAAVYVPVAPHRSTVTPNRSESDETEDQRRSRQIRNRDKSKKSSRSRHEVNVPDDKERKKREKYKESGSRRSEY